MGDGRLTVEWTPSWRDRVELRLLIAAARLAAAMGVEVDFDAWAERYAARVVARIHRALRRHGSSR